MSILRFAASLLFSLGILSPLLSQESVDPFELYGSSPGMSAVSPGQGAEPETKVSWSANAKEYAPGKTFALTLTLEHPEGLHSYYKNPGTVGLPVEVELSAPEQFEIKGPYWSIPHLGSPEIAAYFGSSSPSFTWYVTPKENAPEEASFEVTSSWQMCSSEGCLPPTEPAKFTLSLKKGTDTDVTESPSPVPVEANSGMTKDWSFLAYEEGSDLVLQITTPTTLENLYFYSDTGEILPTATQESRKTDSGYSLILTRNDNKNMLFPVSQETGKLMGMITFTLDGKEQGALLDLPISPPPPVEVIPDSLFQLFLALFIGGLILNLMPCVFPVIGLKVMSFVQMGGGQRRKVVLHSFIFVVGVIISFWAITTLLVILKKSIPHINWAFWLEEPWVIFSLLILMFLMGLSMFGVFEIGTSATGVGATAQQKKGYLGSFYSGVLCTVVATPCTAPFLGASIGPALSLPTSLMYVAFTFMGAGMALPYLILGIFPGLVQKLPKPGAWMESFKQGLSFLLFGTAAWLFWTYLAFYEAGDPLLSLSMILGLVILAFATWIKGRWHVPYKSKKVRITAVILTLLLGVYGLYLSSPCRIKEAPVPGETDPTVIVWEKWSPEVQEKAIKEGRPVYVDFTARWCATCITNKEIAYTQPVAEMIHKYNILMLKADKTTNNPVINKELTRLGRPTVPVNVLYAPGDDTPHITNPILVPSYLQEFFAEHLEE